jgi:hypothetical protein
MAAVVGGWLALADADRNTRLGVAVLSAGVVAAVAGTIGLVEIQLLPRAPPAWVDLLPVVNAASAILLAVGSLAVVRWRWPERPRYVGLGLLLAAWVAYPAVMENEGISNPLGYLVVAAVPLSVGYVLRKDGAAVLATAFGDARSRVVGALSFLAFLAFFTVSTGTVSFNPDVTPAMAGEAFVTVQRVAAPLVYWPAVEFYVPAIPLSGYVSPGTLVLVGLLGGLVATNAGLVTRQWTAAGAVESPRGVVGTVAASGATACCCCAPAVYAAAGAMFGAAASPVYWAFMDPTSPLGGLFFAASVLLLVGSAVRTSHEPACRLPRSRDGAPAGEAAD